MHLDLSPRARVLLPQTDTLHVCLVGVGGTGSALALALSRLAWQCVQKGRHVELTFVDPDRVEATNIGRQFFSPAEIGQNKAETMARRMGAALGLAICAVPAPFDAQALLGGWRLASYGRRSDCLLIGAVDNYRARRALAEAVTRARGNLWWLDLGNAHHSGRIYLGNLPTVEAVAKLERDAVGLVSGLPAPHLQDPALLQPDPAATPLSCAALTAREEQSLLVNQAIAAFAAQYCYDFLLRRELHAYKTTFTLEPPTAVTRRITAASLAALVADVQSLATDSSDDTPIA